MTIYIDIDILHGLVNGKPVMLRDLATTVEEIHTQPGRYVCLYRNDDRGQYRYADTQSDSTGDDAGHPHQ
jgi:hypothetical protein